MSSETLCRDVDWNVISFEFLSCMIDEFFKYYNLQYEWLFCISVCRQIRRISGYRMGTNSVDDFSNECMFYVSMHESYFKIFCVQLFVLAEKFKTKVYVYDRDDEICFTYN